MIYVRGCLACGDFLVFLKFISTFHSASGGGADENMNSQIRHSLCICIIIMIVLIQWEYNRGEEEELKVLCYILLACCQNVFP